MNDVLRVLSENWLIADMPFATMTLMLSGLVLMRHDQLLRFDWTKYLEENLAHFSVSHHIV